MPWRGLWSKSQAPRDHNVGIRHTRLTHNAHAVHARRTHVSSQIPPRPVASADTVGHAGPDSALNPASAERDGNDRKS